MRSFIVVWLAMLAVVAVFAIQASTSDTSQAVNYFFALPFAQKFAVAVFAVMVFWLIGSIFWQSAQTSRQSKQLEAMRRRLEGVKQETVVLETAQHDINRAVQSVAKGDPEEVLTALHESLKGAEAQVASHQGWIAAVDVQGRVEDIRRRHQAIRENLTTLRDRKQEIEPLFGEVRQRQAQLAQALAELEVDSKNGRLADHLNDLSAQQVRTEARLQALNEALNKIQQFDSDLTRQQKDLGPLQASGGGIEFLIADVRQRCDLLTSSLDKMESPDGEPTTARVAAIAKSRIEIEERVRQIGEKVQALAEVRTALLKLDEKKTELHRSLTELEVDGDGNRLEDRKAVLQEFSATARERIRGLEISLGFLNQISNDLTKCRAEIIPLQMDQGGISSVIRDLTTRSDQLNVALNDLERTDDRPITQFVAQMNGSKNESERRVKEVLENLTKLNSIRKDVEVLFKELGVSMEKIR